VGAQVSEPLQGGQRRVEAAGDLIGVQLPAAQPQPIRSPPKAHGTRGGVVGTQVSEQRQGGQRRGQAAGDRIVYQPPAVPTAPARPQPAEADRQMQRARGRTTH
jgi:hypothetical protein